MDKKHRPTTDASKVSASKQSVPSNQSTESTFEFKDNRPQAIAQRKWQDMANNSPKVQQLRAMQGLADRSHSTKRIQQKTKDPSRKQVVPKQLNSSTAPIQRVIINTGEDSLVTELSKENGWIIASDIQVALESGGWNQKIYELNQLGGLTINADENIYLVGHGEEGLLGDKEARTISPSLNAIIPDEYNGIIRSLNCSSGAGGYASGVVKLARRMVQKTIVQGAKGVAINHPSYQGGGRVIPEDRYKEAEPIIEANIQGVHDKWTDYVTATGIIPALFKLDAIFATLISDSFYRDLEIALERRGLLMDKAQDTQSVRRV